jgi:hypothetical protein
MIESKFEYICEGCEKVASVLAWSSSASKVATVQDSVVYECTVYAFVPPSYQRLGCCPFNRPKVKAKKKITKGQQKQGRNR